MADLTGQYLGRYYLVERLGEGGMAAVYKAYDTRLERDVAVKVIRSGAFPPEYLDQVLRRFEREAKALAKLSHPNIVKVHDYGEHEGSPYLVMEYLPGGTLKKIIGRPLPWQNAVSLLLPIARGVAYAHHRGILHRDIKPANILITEDGEPMLSDFGIAKLFEGEQTTTLTGSGVAIGTPEYMAPEQWTGSTSPQSDLYALGIVLYEMVTGRKPYIANTPAAILLKQATEPLPSPRKFVVDLPETLEQILIRALARDPEKRHQDVKAFINGLENLQKNPVAEIPHNHGLANEAYKSPQQESLEFVPAPISSYDHAGTISASDNTKLHKAEDRPSSRTPIPDIKVSTNSSRRGMVLLLGGVSIVGAIWLGWLLIGKQPSSDVIPSVTISMVTSPTLPAMKLEPSSIPAKVFTPTPTPTETMTPTEGVFPAVFMDAKGGLMVLVRQGQFVMGSEGGDPDEQPVHTVYLDAFYIDKYEVTNALYGMCVDAGICKWPDKTTKYKDSHYSKRPVVWVSWEMAKMYCEWRGSRLPTEAEWEKAARGVDGRTFPWGEEIDRTYANFMGIDTMPVGSYPKGASPYGVYDMAGNVREWVSDWYGEAYYSISPGSNPSGPPKSEFRVLRGGAWFSNEMNVRSPDRFTSNQSLDNFGGVGIRCARGTDRY